MASIYFGFILQHTSLKLNLCISVSCGRFNCFLLHHVNWSFTLNFSLVKDEFHFSSIKNTNISHCQRLNLKWDMTLTDSRWAANGWSNPLMQGLYI